MPDTKTSSKRREPKETTRHVEAILKAVDVLECFAARSPLSLKELSDMTGLHKSRIMRICGTLENRGLLMRSEDDGRYGLGPNILMLGRAYERDNSLVTLSRSVLRNMVQATGESASIYVIDGLERICLVREEGTQTIRHHVTEGERFALYVGASGKLLLAYADESIRTKVLKDRPKEKLTPITIVDSERLDRELKRIRQVGHAYSSGERTQYAAAVAVPIFGPDNKVCAAMSMAGLQIRYTAARRRQYLKMLLEGADRLSRALGYSK